MSLNRISAFPDYGEGVSYDLAAVDMFERPATGGGGGGGGDLHPWKVSLAANPTFPVTGDPSAVMTIKGNIVDQILGVTQLELTGWSDENGFSEEITGTGVVCLKYTYGSDGPPPVDPVITLEFQSDDDYEPYDDDGADPPAVTASRYPLAIIIDNPDPPDNPTPADAYLVSQLCRNHLARTTICYNGEGLTTFTPI